MKRYLYLLLTPESLISSMLPPQEFGTYMAVGTKKISRGQAMYFEVDPEMVKDSLPMDFIEKRCVPNEKGEPKRSVYLSIYRVLENIPIRALKSLYLVTYDGRVLELKAGTYDDAKNAGDRLHFYEEISPVTSSIVSTLSPEKFLKFMTDKSYQISVPKLVFTEMALDALAEDPFHGSDENLPYPNVAHLRDCLVQLKLDPKKLKKTVVRSHHNGFLYRTCINGFFAGSKDEFVFYPYPGPAEMNEKHHVWWRSANAIVLNE